MGLGEPPEPHAGGVARRDEHLLPLRLPIVSRRPRQLDGEWLQRFIWGQEEERPRPIQGCSLELPHFVHVW